jgi:heat shock protein HslJ
MIKPLPLPGHRSLFFPCLALIVFTGLAGCVSPPPASTPGEPVTESVTGDKGNGLETPAALNSLADRTWTLVYLYTEGRELFLDVDATPTLAVNKEGRVSGMATINRYFGQMTLEANGRLGWQGPLGAARMAGPQEQMEQEMSFLKGLQMSDRAFFRDGRLILKNEAGSVILEFMH